MKHKLFLFVGVILLAVGILVYYMIGRDGMNITVNGVRDNSGSTKMILQISIGGFLALLGLLFIVGGLRAKSRHAKQQKQMMHIMQTGIATDAKVLFVDKNYTFLVNKKPIYSIVEYTYQDSSGRHHTRRTDTLPSDWVIRKQILVGNMIPIKYDSQDSSLSVMVL